MGGRSHPKYMVVTREPEGYCGVLGEWRWFLSLSGSLSLG